MELVVLWFLLFVSPLAGPQPQGGLFETREACEVTRKEVASVSVLLSKCERVVLSAPEEEA